MFDYDRSETISITETINRSERMTRRIQDKAYDILIGNNGHMKDSGTDLADYLWDLFPESNADMCEIANPFIAAAARAARERGH